MITRALPHASTPIALLIAMANYRFSHPFTRLCGMAILYRRNGGTMQPLDALEALARLPVTDTTDRVGALGQATRIVGAVVESSDVRVFAGDGINYEAYPRREAEDFFQLSPTGLISLSQALRSLQGAAVHAVSRDGLPEDIAPADGQESEDYIAIALWVGNSHGGTLVARGPWEAHAAARAGRFLDAARPALSAVLEHVVDADRVARVQDQMNALANVARVFNRTGSLREVSATS